jgi:hypothetical protein
MNLRSALVLCGLLALAAPGCLKGDPNDRLMTDGELISRFERERASFDSLATMLGEDRTIRFMDGYAEHLDDGSRYVSYHEPGAALPGIPSERWDAYERLLRRIRVGRNVWSTADGILFQQYVQKFGAPETRWMRGYYYARRPLEGARVVGTDLLKAPPSEDGARYRRLEGSWYLYSNHGYGAD